MRSSGTSGASPNTERAKKRKPVDGVVGAAKGVAKKAGALRANASEAVGDLPLVVVGLFTAASALLGGFVLYRLSRQNALR